MESNRESGDGYSDIIVRDRDSALAMVIEVKYAEDGDLKEASEGALRQIEGKRYAGPLYDEKRDPVLKYGIAFCLRKVKAVMGEPVKS